MVIMGSRAVVISFGPREWRSIGLSNFELSMVPPKVIVVASRPGEPVMASSEMGTEILLYFTSTKEARYEIMTGIWRCERKKRGIDGFVYQLMCAKLEPQTTWCT
jgi:hypothetical protein